MMKPHAATVLAGSLHGNFKNFSAVKWCSTINGPVSFLSIVSRTHLQKICTEDDDSLCYFDSPRHMSTVV
jgi:hypothetical protein